MKYYEIVENTNKADVFLDVSHRVHPWEIMVMVLYALLLDVETLHIFPVHMAPMGENHFRPMYVSPKAPEVVFPETKIPVTSVSSFWRIHGADVLRLLGVPECICFDVSDILESKLFRGLDTGTTEYAKDFSSLIQTYLDEEDIPGACLTASQIFGDLVRYTALGIARQKLAILNKLD